MKNKNLVIKILVAVTYAAMVAVNALANILPINGISTGDISDAYPNLFAPAGVTFSIWGVIYLLLGAYVLYQFGLFQKDNGKSKEKFYNQLGIYFIITSIANILWIFAWHYLIIGLSVLLMLVLLITLIKIASILQPISFSPKETVFIKAPFSIYFGWITVATIANITTFLVSIDWSGWGVAESTWMMIILLVGAGIGIARTVRDMNLLYGLVLIWAYFGILIKHTSEAGFNGLYPMVIEVVLLCLVAFTAANISVFYKSRKAISA